MNVCSVDGCDKPTKAKGYCKLHHLQWWRTGDPTMRQRRPSEPLVAGNYETADNGCWNWTGYVDANGYGKAYDPDQHRGQRLDWAHRVSYRNFKGDIPPGHEIDHVCQNTLCINPAHLDAVTKKEHARRTFERMGYEGIQRQAAYLRSMKLTYGDIAEILGMAGKESAHRHVMAAIRKGLVDPAAVPPAKRLTDEDREDIRTLNAMGIPQADLGAFFEIDSSQVSRIINGKTSGHARSAS